MLYSQWNPAVGGYAYFETPEQINIADDLPTPNLPKTSPLGVPSVIAGRRLPSGATPAGHGPLPQGMIVPTESRGVLGLLAVSSHDLFVAALSAVGGFLIATWWRRRR